METSFAVDEKRQRRFFGATSGMSRSSLLDKEGTDRDGGRDGGNDSRLPALKEQNNPGGAELFGQVFKRDKVVPKVLPMPGPKQAAAAERLMRGYSTAKQTAAALGGDGAAGEDGTAGVDGEGQGEGQGGKYTEQVVYAKQWRQRVEAQRNRRNIGYALKPTTFMFVEDQGGGGGGGGGQQQQQGGGQQGGGMQGQQQQQPHQGSSGHFGPAFGGPHLGLGIGF